MCMHACMAKRMKQPCILDERTVISMGDHSVYEHEQTHVQARRTFSKKQ